MSKYHVVGFSWRGDRFASRAAFLAAMKARGIYPVGRSPVGGYLQRNLQGQPTFRELAGPFAGEGDVVRYETPEVNDMLSR